MKTRALLAAFAILALACGKRGDPRPPVPVIPAATTDLVVAQRADKVVLTWSYPALTTAGRSLGGVRRIAVFRYAEELPATALEADAAEPRALAAFAKIPVVPKPQFVKLATRIESIERDGLGAATAGSKLVFTDVPALTTSDGRPMRLTYAVVTEGESERGEASNLAAIVPLPVALAPDGLKASPKPEGVVLDWTAATAAVGGGAPFVAGYNVYRTAPGEAPNELAQPVNASPVAATTYVDAPSYGEHEYRVAAVAVAGLPRAESALSEPVRANFRDLLPPPVPANLTPLIETGAIRLIWDPVEAPDLAGYKVYRYEGAGHEQILEVGGFPLTPHPIAETTYTNLGPDLGITFRYEVTSVDKSGNESAPAKTGWVVVPKTP